MTYCIGVLLKKRLVFMSDTWSKPGDRVITMLANNPATANMNREEFIGTLFLLIVGRNDTTRNSMTGDLLSGWPLTKRKA